MVLQLWTETSDRMLVRVTQTVDLSRRDATTTWYASSKAEVLGLTERWLDALVTPR